MIITCLGDSICYGYGVEPAEAWVSLLAKELAGDVPALKVINAGVNGESATDGLTRLAGLLVPPPDILYVQFGLNDAAMGKTIEEYLEYMQKIVHRSLERGVSRVLVATNHPVSPEEYFPGGGAYRQAAGIFNAALRGVFASPDDSRIRFADMERLCENLGDIQTQASMLQYDGDHLNAEGNRIYCRLLLPFFRDCIKSLRAD